MPSLASSDRVTRSVRHALRIVRLRPGFSAAVILTLALGIGVTTAIFSVVNGVLLRPLPFAEESRLVTICETYPGASNDWCSISPPNVADIAEQSRTIERIGIARSWSAHMATPSGAEGVNAGIATPDVFRALGVGVERGRMIDSTDLLGRESDVAMITHEMWQARFGGSTDIVGRTLELDAHPVRIVGVLAPGFHLPLFESIELWRPVHIDPRSEQHRDWRGFVAYGRLARGVTAAAAREDLARIARSLAAAHFAATPTWGLTEMPMRDLVVRGVRPPLLLFLGAVLLVFLVACANVGNLLLAQGAARRREMALRSALGAATGRIAGMLLVESATFAVLGALGGLGIAQLLLRAFQRLAPEGMPRVAQVTIDVRVAMFAAALAIVTSLLVGVVPAWRASRVDLAQSLRAGGRSGSTRRSRLGTALVVGELAMAVLLIAGAGTFARSFGRSMRWDPGFDREHLALFSVSPSAATYDSRASLAALWDRLEGSLGAIPGVQGVGTASAGPLFGSRETWEMEIEGHPPEQRSTVRWSDVSPGYFDALGVPLRAGRALDARDRPGTPDVVVVNETLARRFWPNESPLGKHVTFPVGNDRMTFEVVGVVADVPPTEPGASPEPEMYWSNRQQPRPYTWVVVRTGTNPAALVDAMREAVHQVDRDLVVQRVQTMPQLMDVALASSRFNTVLIVAFGSVALLLAAIGTYGLLRYTVALRQREIAIRLAIGASPGEVARRVAGDGLGMTAAGLALGVAAYFGLSGSLAAMAPGVPPRDLGTLLFAATTLLVVAAAACGGPAWRASRVEPSSALGDDGD